VKFPRVWRISETEWCMRYPFTYRIAPGSTVTSATAMVVATGKIVESTIFTDPPFNAVEFMVDIGKTNASGTCP
jgi:hypothetical protein